MGACLAVFEAQVVPEAQAAVTELAEAQTTLYKTFKAGSGCGQATLDSKYAQYAIKFAGLSEGTCAALGYTLADGTQTLKVPVLGDITIAKFKKAAVTQLEDVCVLYKLANDECFESGIIDCKFVKGAKFFDVKGFKDGTCAAQGYTVKGKEITKKYPVV